jgi:hypothetical protein
MLSAFLNTNPPAPMSLFLIDPQIYIPGPPKSTDNQKHVVSSILSQSSSPSPHVLLLLPNIKLKIRRLARKIVFTFDTKNQ